MCVSPPEVAPAKLSAPGSKNAVAEKGKQGSIASKQSAPSSPLELRYDEKLSTKVGRNGDVRSLEVLGMLMLRVREEGAAVARFKMSTQKALTQRPGITLQVQLQLIIITQNAHFTSPLHSSSNSLSARARARVVYLINEHVHLILSSSSSLLYYCILYEYCTKARCTHRDSSIVTCR